MHLYYGIKSGGCGFRLLYYYYHLTAKRDLDTRSRARFLPRQLYFSLPKPGFKAGLRIRTFLQEPDPKVFHRIRCHKPCKKYEGQEKCVFFKAGSGSGFKILICRIRIWPKMDRIPNPDSKGSGSNGIRIFPKTDQVS